MPKSLSLLTIGGLSAAFLMAPALNAQSSGLWTEYRVHVGPDNWSHYGLDTISVGDLDADGTADYLVSAYSAFNPSNVAAGAAFLYSGASGNLIREHYGDHLNGNFGNGMVAMNDVNGDGVHDYVISEPGYPATGGTSSGLTWMYSGADGSVIYTIPSVESMPFYGRSMTAVPDFNGDGIGDLAVGNHGTSTHGYLFNGSVFLYSGADGSLMREFHGVGDRQHFGFALENCGDMNGDGHPDLLVASRSMEDNVARGIVSLFCGRTQSLLQTLDSPHHASTEANLFGHHMLSLGDWNGDGYQELAVADQLASSPTLDHCGAVYIYDGRTSNLIKTIYGDGNDRRLGFPLVAIGDVDGDGFRDFASAQLARTNEVFADGTVIFYSGADGQAVHRMHGEIHHGVFGRAIADATDLNGDGRDEVLIGAPGYGLGFGNLPELQIWSWQP
jgi:hypothetical protein